MKFPSHWITCLLYLLKLIKVNQVTDYAIDYNPFIFFPIQPKGNNHVSVNVTCTTAGQLLQFMLNYVFLKSKAKRRNCKNSSWTQRSNNESMMSLLVTVSGLNQQKCGQFELFHISSSTRFLNIPWSGEK